MIKRILLIVITLIAAVVIYLETADYTRDVVHHDFNKLLNDHTLITYDMIDFDMSRKQIRSMMRYSKFWENYDRFNTTFYYKGKDIPNCDIYVIDFSWSYNEDVEGNLELSMVEFTYIYPDEVTSSEWFRYYEEKLLEANKDIDPDLINIRLVAEDERWIIEYYKNKNARRHWKIIRGE